MPHPTIVHPTDWPKGRVRYDLTNDEYRNQNGIEPPYYWLVARLTFEWDAAILSETNRRFRRECLAKAHGLGITVIDGWFAGTTSIGPFLLEEMARWSLQHWDLAHNDPVYTSSLLSNIRPE